MKLLTNNLGLKVFALLLAIFIYHSLKPDNGNAKGTFQISLDLFRNKGK